MEGRYSKRGADQGGKTVEGNRAYVSHYMLAPYNWRSAAIALLPLLRGYTHLPALQPGPRCEL